MAQPTVTEPT